jgi:hypothetical protein
MLENSCLVGFVRIATEDPAGFPFRSSTRNPSRILVRILFRILLSFYGPGFCHTIPPIQLLYVRLCPIHLRVDLIIPYYIPEVTLVASRYLQQDIVGIKKMGTDGSLSLTNTHGHCRHTSPANKIMEVY